ncbi:heavy metal translocating P-type ATPase [Magnetospirillum sulfuroxidans]|uniref:heavy metal translocating P-type ATPase n=1 Tax=Magnetospirillum sulfuroxidans TaxID=611300 RepID=UPI0031FE508C
MAELPWWRQAAVRLLFVCGVLLAAAYVVAWLVPSWADWVMVVPLTVAGLPVLRRAGIAAIGGTPFSIEMLMSVAIIGAIAIGAWDEAAMVVFLFLVGESLEGLAARQARAGIRALTDLLPKQAWRRQDGHWVEVLAATLRAGDVVLVRPGDRLPVDGEIVVGRGGLDEAPVTGESMPRQVSPGDAVFAGTINLESVLEVRATGDVADNTMARIVRLVEQAQQAKAPTARFIDRLARWYTPAVVAVAALVMVGPPLLAGQDWGQWFYKGLALLLIGCPCALVISTPAAIAAGLAAGARRGLLMKGGAVLERLAAVTRVAFDKTGTLTAGRPQVTDVLADDGDEDRWLAVAAGVSVGSGHPVAVAIRAYAAAGAVTPLAIEDAAALPGQGSCGRWGGAAVFLGAVAAARQNVPVAGEWSAAAERWAGDGKTVSVLVVADRVVLVIALRDGLRRDAVAGIDHLRRLGIGAEMLTGDQRVAAEAVGGPLRMRVHAALLPAEKLALVRGWQAEGAVVAKVGDGINDAPALAAADIGIAMGGGSEIALETADAAILHGRVDDVAAMIVLARRTMANIRQNVALALGLKALFLVTTIAGLTGLWPAVLADTGATVLVTLNALRLLRK